MESKKISYLMANGKKITTVKQFRNLAHFDNYYNKLIKNGCNVQSIETINPYLELTNNIFNFRI